MAQLLRAGDVVNDAVTKGGIAQVLLMPFVVWGIQWFERYGLIFPMGYDIMASAAVGMGIIKLWAFLRLRAHLEREKM